mmetsp:Transcript_49111/g.59510  ORF Transcript_49111/g.59510 Transcript_49111/m.59510 type:complete len:657 (+) Transcript_49111:146-2116(+)|eukprot:CAMPEP_0172485296 /NCGR_PEP_ID=MMETSP1066-20121228/13284_1 /TAXON_ID=671091 /ORGANISM="Coscinodiscus wailesii, Strain CCMP2513" /LENGTH=656 /DNA_ID=CAMNT_0013250473 /DNA_START=128 /DNA_END=2098 /DNA_ORIENTATION=+
MSHHPLTPGAVRDLVNGAASGGFTPTLQVINVKQYAAGVNSTERFRLILSDGTHYVQAMLATQINNLVHDGSIVENSIITVKEFLTNLVHNKTVAILLGLDIMQHSGGRIGNPVDIETDKSGGMQGHGSQQPQAAPAQPMYANNQSNMPRQPKMEPQPTPQQSSYNNNPYGGSPAASNPYGTSNRYSQNRFNNSSSSAPIVSSNNSRNSPYTHISQLNMYQNKWTIKARVTSKSPVKTWSNARGDGSLFSAELLDSSGMDIRATFFKEAVDKFNPLLEVDRVFSFSGGRLKVANAQWNTCKSQYEITFDQNAEIHLVGEDASIQHNMFDFKKIADLENVEPNTTIDLLCIVKNVGAVSTVISKKTGQELFKSDMTVVDDSGAEVNMTIWGEGAKTAQQKFMNTPVVAFKNLRVSDFGGRSLSVNQGGAIVHNPPIPQTNTLKNWWQNEGGNARVKSLSSIGGTGRQVTFQERKVISSVKDEQMGYGEKPDWVTFKATFSFVKKDREGGPWYTACANPNDPCKNRCKVSFTTSGDYHCERCNTTRKECVRRFIFSASVLDDSSNTWLSIFDEQAKTLLGGEISADQMNDQCFGENYDTDAFESYFAKVLYTDWIITAKVKNEVYGDDARVKLTAYQMTELDYVKESQDMLDEIMKFQ